MKSAVVLALTALIGVPVLWPVAEALASPDARAVWTEADRLLSLSRNTLLLVAGTLAITLPLGVPISLLLYRTRFPWRRGFRAVVLIALFVPLPLTASAWQAAFGSGGWTTWDQGLGPSVAVHSLAALPWVIWLTGLGLARVERELEEEARLTTGPMGVAVAVTLPRAAPAVALAALWVAVTAAGEMTVTDLMMVRTFAEEVYTQFVGAGDGMARSVAAALPGSLVMAAIAAGVLSRWDRRRSNPEAGGAPRPLFRAGRTATVAVGSLALLLAGVPLAALIWKGGAGHLGDWDSGVFVGQFVSVPWAHGRVMLSSLAWAFVAGACVSALALSAAWVGRDSPRVAGSAFGLAILAWTLPGPVVGFGLKSVIDAGMDLEEWLTGRGTWHPWRAAMYDGPSPLPVLWAHVVRMFPFALAILWPAVRGVPRDLIELGRLEGATPGSELRRVIWPTCRGAFAVSVAATGILSLGELGASKLVQTPGHETFAQLMFDQMHYGVGPSLAAMCLWQVAFTGVVVTVMVRAGSRRPLTD